MWRGCQAFLLAAIFGLVVISPAQVPPSAFVNFEGALTNPIRISADGTRLFALNTPDARLSVFDLTQPSSPALMVEIQVGIEPVSVNINPNVPGNDEAWVVNQVSGSVSVVSVSKGIVTDTIYAKAEPSDLVFAGNGLAFVSIARSNLINVYNATTHALVKSISLTGENPRAMAASLDGSMVYAAFALSGNHSTLVPASLAPPQPPPTNKSLPPPPQVSLIVDASNPAWSNVIQYSMPDNDVVAIDTTSLSVNTYFSHLGTINLGLTVNPKSGGIYVANTDALNLVMFEPNLRGHMVNHRIAMVDPTTGHTQIWDLNPGINYSILPNPAALASALAVPASIVFEPTGRYLYIAAFGTDRVGIFDTTTGMVTSFIEIDPQATGSTVNPASKRGPRGLALDAAANLLYVLNRIYNTISIVSLSSNTVIAEIPTGSFDPTPYVIRKGRGFLYDHKLSGNGTAACASCHVDAEMDLLAWDLGDPGGNMTTLKQGNKTFQFHPMKGPMTTQTLRGLKGMAPYHWRGDQPDFAAFNAAFSSLMGGSPLSDTDMKAYTNFINTVVYLPNPNQNLDRTMPNSVPLPDRPGMSANPNLGQTVFNTVVLVKGGTCGGCHVNNPGTGSDLLVRLLGSGPESQPFKTPQMRDVYQKTNLSFKPAAVSVDGFGFDHDGGAPGLFALTNAFHSMTPVQNEQVEAFEICFDTGTAPAVGYARTLTSANVNGGPAQGDWNTLQSQASAGNIDLIANGTIQGQLHGLLYQPSTNNYETDTTGLGPFTQAQLVTFIGNGDTLTIMGVPLGSGVRMGLDRNLDGVLNGDETHATQTTRQTKTR